MILKRQILPKINKILLYGVLKTMKISSASYRKLFRSSFEITDGLGKVQ